jgi:superfamily II DNA helicase RecQ
MKENNYEKLEKETETNYEKSNIGEEENISNKDLLNEQKNSKDLLKILDQMQNFLEIKDKRDEKNEEKDANHVKSLLDSYDNKMLNLAETLKKDLEDFQNDNPYYIFSDKQKKEIEEFLEVAEGKKRLIEREIREANLGGEAAFSYVKPIPSESYKKRLLKKIKTFWKN